MATITKRMTKSGPSYRIQVKMRDKGSGKDKVYTTTWRPPAGLTQKQMERESILYAAQYEKDIKASITNSGTDGVSPDTTLGEYAQWWLERRKNEIAASYYVNCRNALKDIIPNIGGYKLKELNPTIIQRFYDQLDKKQRTITKVSPKPELKKMVDDVKKGRRKLQQELDRYNPSLISALHGKNIELEYAERIAKNLGCNINSIFQITMRTVPVAYETIHKTKRTLRAILSHAKKQRIINDNYASADYIDFPKRPPREIDYMNDEDAKKFYAAAMGYHDMRVKTAAILLLLTGIRRGELAGLEWRDIDFEDSSITIERSVTTVATFGVVEKEPKTESSKRTISISDKLLGLLREYRVWYEQYRTDMGDQWVQTGRVIIGEYGNKINPGTIGYWMRKICDVAGLPHRTVHSLRHTNITMQIAAGVPLVTVAGRAGHARTSTTTDIYSHFLKSSDKTAADRLEKIFDEG